MTFTDLMHKCQIGVAQTAAPRLALVQDLIRARVASLPVFSREHITMVEVGSYEGVSAVHWAHAIVEAGGRGVVYCVDPWEPYLGAVEGLAGQMDADLGAGDVIQRFLANAQLAPPEIHIVPYKGTFRAFPCPQADIIYIDGSHKFVECLHDIRKACSVLVLDGLLCGDDLEREVREDDAEALAHAEEDCFGPYHPGVSLAVSRMFGYGRVWNRDGVWAVRKTITGWTTEGLL